jgi:glycerophosphoryl diester phosphodiesterase
VNILAHRGFHRGDSCRENSPEAVRDAFDSSANGLEVDLQQLADNRFVLHHDDRLDPDRFNVSSPRPLNALTLEDFRQTDGRKILTLEDVFELDWQGKTFVFECKPSRNRHAFARALIGRLFELENPGDYRISCSDSVLLREFLHRMDPALLAPVITRSNPSAQFLKESTIWGEYHVREDLCTTGTFDNCPWFPDETIAWTVNDEKRRRELERIGIKGIMTDNHTILSGT